MKKPATQVFSILGVASLLLGIATPAIAADYGPSLADPNVFTFQNNAPTISGATGALTQTVPIDLPPGRNGLGANLSLQYNSQNTDQASEVGYGWSLSIPYIQRVNKTGSQDLYGPNAVFTSSIDGELTATTTSVPSTGNLNYLVVGGGGGGGSGSSGGGAAAGGGGGAGGFLSGVTSVAPGTYTISVGSGGGGGSSSTGGNGTNSSVFGITAVGGGGGGVQGINPNDGGSGGGGGANTHGSATLGQGHNGGTGSSSGGAGGGGGGAGDVGADGNQYSIVGGPGGPGLSSAISGTATYYAGGGGGAGSNGSSAGGIGGGGNAGGTGGDATANTGGGGGGGLLGGGAGGSGIVILSYATTSASNYTCGGTATTTGSNTVCTFTSAGTFTVAASTAAPLATNLKGYWALNDISGNAADSSGGGRALTNNGTIPYSTTYGLLNKGISVNGSSQYLSRSDGGLAVNSSLSTNLWVNFQNASGTQYLISREAGSTATSSKNFYLYYSGGSLHGGYYDGSSAHEAVASWTPTLGKWYQLTLVVDMIGGHVYDYANGTQIASTTTGAAPTSTGTQPLVVGGAYQNPSYGNLANAYIDEVGYWSRALSTTEVSQLYNGGVGLSSGSYIPSLPISYLPRVDQASNKYTYATSTNMWTMFDKKGNEYFFGSSNQSQQYASSTPSNVYKWMLERVQDTNGNFVRYQYTKDGNQIYPSNILYTGHDAIDGPMTISFTTATRTDPTINFDAGFEVDTNLRVSKITSFINGSTTETYTLGYGVGNNGYKSVLKSVQENAWNDHGVLISEPAMTFNYVNDTTSFVSQGSGAGSCDGDSWVAADASGDGVNDLTTMQSNPGGGSGYGWVHGSGGGVAQAITPVTVWADGSNSCLADQGGRMLDTNGNGKANVVTNLAGSSSFYTNTFATSTGTFSWTATSTYTGTIPIFAFGGITGPVVSTGLFGNLNGTGLPSYEFALPNSDGNSSYNGAYLGNGSAWNLATTTIFQAPMTVPDGSPDCTGIQFVDINGDGLDDWVYSTATTTLVRLNTGTGWQSTPDASFTIATSTLNSSGGNCYDRGMRFVDINGDGLPDFIRSYSATSTIAFPELGTFQFVYLNTGSGWATSTAYTSLPYIIDAFHTGQTYNELFNFKGNGQQDQDVLSTITYPKGGSTSITYGYSTQSGTNQNLPYNLLVPTSVVNHDGRGSNEETDYSYANGLQYLPASNVFDRKFAGFGSITASTSQFATVTYYSQGATSSALVAGDQSDGYAEVGYPYRKDTRSVAGNLIQSIFYQYNPVTHGSSSFMSLIRKLEQDYAPDGSHADKDTDYAFSTTTNDLLQTVDYGQVSGNSDGTFSTTTASTPRTTTYTYASNATVNSSLVTEKTLFNERNATTTDTRYFYDGLSFGNVNLGNQTQEQDWVSGTHYASSTRAYNPYGLVATSTDFDGNATTFSFDTYNFYPATTTDALRHVTTRTFNYANGKAEQTRNSNGGITLVTYDGVGREVEEDDSDPNSPSSLLTKLTIAYTDNSSPPSIVHETDYLSSASTTNTYDYYDGLARLVQERKSTENSGTYAVTDRTYDTAGNLASQSLPYFSSGSSNTTATTTSALYTSYVYDPLGRLATTTNAIGSNVNTYAGWITTTIDPNGNIKDYILDAFGNLSKVVEHNPSSNATTTYNYTAINALATTTDALGNVRVFSYDALGRRLSATDLHAAATTTYGTWSYVYDDQGNETSRTDPNNNTITHSYDALSRMLTESLSGHGVQVTNTYDNCTSGIGQLCSASSTGALDTYAYDVLGRTLIATTTVQGTGYPLAYAYDRQGNVTNLTDSDGSVTKYLYNGAGLVSNVSRTVGTTTASSIASLMNFAPTNAFGTVVFGSNASTTYTYDPNALYRLSRILTLGTASPSIVKVNVSLWGGGGGGGAQCTTSGAGSGGGAGAYVNRTIALNVGTGYAITIGQGGGGGTNGSPAGTAGAGYAAGGGGGSNGGGGGGGSTAFGPGILIAAGGGGGGGSSTSHGGYGASGTTGGGGADTGTCVNEIGGGGGAATQGGTGNSGGAGGTGATNASVISGNGGISTGGTTVGGGGAGSAGGFSGNGNNGANTNTSTGGVGGSGSGGAAHAANGAPGESGGGGSGGNYNVSGESGGTPGAGGGGQGYYGGTAGVGGNGASGMIVISYPTAVAADFVCNGSATTTGSNTTCTYTSNGLFKVATSTVTASSSPWVGTLQDLNYTYDAAGNILSRTDNSDMAQGQQVTYSYDNLNRLKAASTTSGASTFSYDALGNMLTGPGGAYTYGQTSNANPDAVTRTVLTTGNSSSTIAYDNSGKAGSSIPSSSLTFSYTDNNHTNGLIVISVSEATSSPSCTGDVVTGVADNAIPLTDLGYYVRNNSIGALKTYYGFDPTQGTHNIVVSASASCILYANAVTYTGVKQSGMPNASGTGNPLTDSGPVTRFQATTTPSGINAWTMLIGVPPKTAITATAGPGTKIRQQQSGGIYYADSNGPVTGASGLSWTTASSTDWIGNYFAISPLSSYLGTTSTTTYAYDKNGNLVSQITGATTTTYVYDYQNRLTALGVNGATTTYAYDAFGNRVLQANALATTTYPSNYYSIISTTVGSTTTATSTLYAYDGKTLLATIDQVIKNGIATGTPITRYVHSDNLGSTQATSDSIGNLAQAFSYAPYGSVLNTFSTGSTTIAKGYIGQYSDTSGLSYLNARYYNPQQGQFLSQDPMFRGDPNQQNLQDPQSLNSYSYSDDNPIIKSDPSGRFFGIDDAIEVTAVLTTVFRVYSWAQTAVDLYDFANTDFRYRNVTSQKDKFSSTMTLGTDLLGGALVTGAERAFGKVGGLVTDGVMAEYTGVSTLQGEVSDSPSIDNPNIIVSNYSLNDRQVNGKKIKGARDLDSTLTYEGNSGGASSQQSASRVQNFRSGSSLSGGQMQALGRAAGAFGFSGLTDGQIQAALGVKAAFGH